MPLISSFYGILIYMYWQDHAPPHFHAIYGEFEAQIDIATLNVINGSLPNTALKLVKEWGQLHQAELMADWEKTQKNAKPDKIEPLK
jgi:hypothetical protein